MSETRSSQSEQWLQGWCRDHGLPNISLSLRCRLQKSIDEYLQWMKDQGHPDSTRDDHQLELEHFIAFVQHGRWGWDQIFSFDVLELFQKQVGKNYGRALRALSWYLFMHQKIKRPIDKHFVPLPPVYEQYLAYRQKSGQVTERTVKQIRRVLVAFCRYLKNCDVDLGTLKIDQVDDFLAQFLVGFAPATCRLYRGYLKGFLRHLYHHTNGRNLAPLVVGRRLYAQHKPPKFLRPNEVNKLFAGLSLSSLTAIRTHAMVHLAYFLGLRPVEIHSISLDDICFTKAELTIRRRKNDNPIVLPIPPAVLKAVSAYMIGARPRPQSKCRTLFLSHQSPHGPLCAGAVAYYMTAAIRQAGINGTAYWLRHTYAQNLLESGATIFEIKQMLGHDKIESTKVYLHVHIKLMRKVLFDE